jgi:hypothetical protein
MKTLGPILFLLVVSGVAFSQSPKQCPTVWVAGPSATYELVATSESITFAAHLRPSKSPAQPEYRWKVSAGTIASGQGTPKITVDVAGLGNLVITARVSVGGLASPAEASRSVTLLPMGMVCGLPFDQYGDVNIENEMARLDNFAIQLQNDGTAQGHIFAYAGKRTYPGEALQRVQRAKDYLVNVSGIEPERVVAVDGGYRTEFSVTLIIAPRGAAPPSASPEFSPCEIELTKRRPHGSAKRKKRQ